MPTEAAIAHEVFDRFAAGDNCNGIACAMNARCVAAFGGRRWCLLTMRRMLLNETYTGRSIYRPDKERKYRAGRSASGRAAFTERNSNEWIEIEGQRVALGSPTPAKWFSNGLTVPKVTRLTCS